MRFLLSLATLEAHGIGEHRFQLLQTSLEMLHPVGFLLTAP
jgi:hypothetical protein